MNRCIVLALVVACGGKTAPRPIIGSIGFIALRRNRENPAAPELAMRLPAHEDRLPRINQG